MGSLGRRLTSAALCVLRRLHQRYSRSLGPLLSFSLALVPRGCWRFSLMSSLALLPRGCWRLSLVAAGACPSWHLAGASPSCPRWRFSLVAPGACSGALPSWLLALVPRVLAGACPSWHLAPHSGASPSWLLALLPGAPPLSLALALPSGASLWRFPLALVLALSRWLWRLHQRLLSFPRSRSGAR